MWAISKSSSTIPHDTCQMKIAKSWGGSVSMRGSLLGQKALGRTQLCYNQQGDSGHIFFNLLELYLPYFSSMAGITFLIGLWRLKRIWKNMYLGWLDIRSYHLHKLCVFMNSPRSIHGAGCYYLVFHRGARQVAFLPANPCGNLFLLGWEKETLICERTVKCQARLFVLLH